jgi:hypothetical protein
MPRCIASHLRSTVQQCCKSTARLPSRSSPLCFPYEIAPTLLSKSYALEQTFPEWTDSVLIHFDEE